jgi:hypothetical protein
MGGVPCKVRTNCDQISRDVLGALGDNSRENDAPLVTTFCLLAIPAWAQAQAIARMPDGKPDRRYIYTNGTKHPEGHIDWWMGDSRSRWEGDALVVDVIHFNDQTWFDRAGNHHSQELHVVERYTPMGPDHMQCEATIEDPKVFTRPWKMSTVLYRRKEPNVRLLEYECYGFEFEKIYPYPEVAEGKR